METPLRHALPTEVVDILDATALFLAQLVQAAMLPPPWDMRGAVLLTLVQMVIARHVYRGEGAGSASTPA